MQSPIEEQQRYEVVVAKGMEVFRNRTAVAVWLARFNPMIADGLEQPSSACRTARGFLETMAELDRLALGSATPTYSRQRGDDLRPG